MGQPASWSHRYGQSDRASSASPLFLFGLDGTCTPWPESDGGKMPKKFLFVK